MPRIPAPLTWKRRNFAVFEHLGMIDRLYAVAVSGLVSGPFAIYKHLHVNGFVFIYLPSQAKIIELEMQHVCKHAAEKFAALDLNWWTCLPEEVIGPDLQEMRNIHLRLKPTPGSPAIGGGGTGEPAPPVLSAPIRALNPWGRRPAGSVIPRTCVRISPQMDKSFDVFLSHNSKDKPAVREVAEALRGLGLNVWFDEWNLVPGRRWIPELEKAIETTSTVAVLVGESGMGPWEQPEYEASLREFVRRGLPVIPVLLPGAPAEIKLPLFLSGFTWVDFRSGLNEGEIDRLVWGITGKRLDRSKPLSAPVAAPEAVVGAPAAVPRWDQSRAALSGETFIEPLTGICFLWIPGGRFQMGGDAYDDEKPVHWVRISPFWLAETPVTNRQYAVFLEKTGAREPGYWRDQRFSSLDQPVVSVSWDDAQAFCHWLTDVAGRQVMLPSEAQWEFAARGVDGREYPWGNEPPDETRACFAARQPEPVRQPNPVGSYPAGRGPFGTLDQAGNVWELCRDAWNAEAYAERTKREREPVDPVEGESLAEEEVLRVVIRGGGWIDPAEDLQAAHRNSYPAWERSHDIGFRVAAAPLSLDA